MRKDKKVDPLTLSLIEGRLDSLSEELGTRMMRQCFSYPTAHIRDLGTTVFDKQERILSMGNWMPVHTGGSDVCLKGMLDYIGRDNIHPGDFIIGNDPFIVRFGHAPDWSFFSPVFYEDELMFYLYLRTHQYDGGGAFPGGYFPRAFDCIAEGLMIPPVKIMEEGRYDEKVHSLILRNTRGASMVRADNMLIYASMKRAEERVLDLLESYGKDTVLAACNEIISRTEETVRRAISAWPRGVYKAEAAADWDGTTDRKVWVRVSLTVKPEEGQLVFDFSDSDPQCDFINTPLGQTWAAVVTGVAWSLPPGTPRNQGLVNCITVITKEGTVLGPTYPATSGCQAVTLGQEITECVQLSLSQVVPNETSAVWGKHVNPVLTGKRRDKTDPRTGGPQYYMLAGFQASPNMGALYGYDGDNTTGPTISAGAILRSPIEVDEWEAPYRWLNHEFSIDSAGDGQWRGGLGIHFEVLNTIDPKLWQPLDYIAESGNSGGTKSEARGILGGKNGKKNELSIIRRGELVEFRSMDLKYLESGDIVVVKSGGGGGFGNPLNRDIEKVRMDALDEYISIETARDIYGVVVNPESFEVDSEATKELRKNLKSQKKGGGKEA